MEQLQRHYHVTPKEFEKAQKKEIKKAYKKFERLRGKPLEAYEHYGMYLKIYGWDNKKQLPTNHKNTSNNARNYCKKNHQL